jgi:hypothetical protein
MNYYPAWEQRHGNSPAATHAVSRSANRTAERSRCWGPYRMKGVHKNNASNFLLSGGAAQRICDQLLITSHGILYMQGAHRAELHAGEPLSIKKIRASVVCASRQHAALRCGGNQLALGIRCTYQATGKCARHSVLHHEHAARNTSTRTALLGRAAGSLTKGLCFYLRCKVLVCVPGAQRPHTAATQSIVCKAICILGPCFDSYNKGSG